MQGCSDTAVSQEKILRTFLFGDSFWGSTAVDLGPALTGNFTT